MLTSFMWGALCRGGGVWGPKDGLEADEGDVMEGFISRVKHEGWLERSYNYLEHLGFDLLDNFMLVLNEVMGSFNQRGCS